MAKNFDLEADLNDVVYEMYKEFCRLKGYSQPTTPIEQMVDEATGNQEARMKEFVVWLKEEVLTRFSPHYLIIVRRNNI